MNVNWTALLRELSGLSTVFIMGAAVVHLVCFVTLWVWYRGSLKRMASALDDFTRNLRHRSVLDRSSHLSDQIEQFLADVREVLGLQPGSPDRVLLRDRISILDEKRRFANSLTFETGYNICRNMIEAYPLAGVLGTVLAIGAALQADRGPDQEATEIVSLIVGRFGEAIWSTFVGLAVAIVFMFINSFLEPAFERLQQNREHARDTVAQAKRELALATDSDTRIQTSPITGVTPPTKTAGEGVRG